MLVFVVKKEILFDPLRAKGSLEDGTPSWAVRPLTLIEALQRASPHQEPVTSREERIDLQEIVLDALDSLEEWERWLLNAVLFERMSLRQIEFVLGIPKTTVARRRDSILKKLRVHLEKEMESDINSPIRRYLYE